MRMALHTMLKDSGFNISISRKEAQICASNMLESLYTAEKKNWSSRSEECECPGLLYW